MLLLKIIQSFGFCSAQITNSILIYLLLKKAEKLFGSYRHVMCTFAVFSLLYSWVEVVTLPLIHIKGPVFIVFMDGPIKYEKWIGNTFTCLFCGSFALVISLLAAQFFYRYVAVCRSELLPKLDGYRLILIFIPCFVCFGTWFEFVYWGMVNTEEKQQYVKEDLDKYYGEDSTKVSFIAPMYWSIEKNGEKKWNILDLMSSVGCFFIIVICFSTICFCAYNMYSSMKKTQYLMSAKTLEMNRQLFATLIFQTILPFIMLYSPVGLLLTLPLFEIPAGKLASLAGASVAVYPALEPLIAMICIKEFRRILTSKFYI